MTGPSMLHRVEEPVHRSHSDHITDLAAAALIEQHGRFLLVQGKLADLNTPRGWQLPTGPVWPGETVVDGLHRTLAQGFGYSDAEITAFLGATDSG
ncbi:NUDIX domain-containing protein, partial [Streptomyces sp. NPDC001817]|uniref:NUDIX hydrolase n=1 Tax=Streptomyces sp. NPDC001817 TaxID=3154398 RepID=UPI0033245CCF